MRSLKGKYVYLTIWILEGPILETYNGEISFFQSHLTKFSVKLHEGYVIVSVYKRNIQQCVISLWYRKITSLDLYIVYFFQCMFGSTCAWNGCRTFRTRTFCTRTFRTRTICTRTFRTQNLKLQFLLCSNKWYMPQR